MIKISGCKLNIIFAMIIALLTIKSSSFCQNSISEIEFQGILTNEDAVPFWLRSNQFGSIPVKGLSGSVLGRSHKDYMPKLGNHKKELIDWGYGIEARLNIGKVSDIKVIQGYLKGKLGIFQLKVGRDLDITGLNGDSLLTSGNFSVSGNALGVPKISLSIPTYYKIPILDGILSVKGSFSHGWLGNTRVRDSIVALGPNPKIYYLKNTMPVTYLHEKSLYFKLGKPNWRINLYGGFNHQVQWGNEKAAYGSNFKLSDLESFFYVATGKTYGSVGVPSSKIGNQLGSIDLGIDYEFSGLKVMIYRQNFYDVGALSKLANITDGLNGITFENLNYNPSSNLISFEKVLFELFYSKDQAGYPWSTPTKSGDEDYYNNFYYLNGWSYENSGIGSPFITRALDAKKGQTSKKEDYFINNRVIAFHTGVKGIYKNINFIFKGSYSINHGTFGTSIYGKSTGTIRSPQTTNLFSPVNQLSVFFSASKQLNSKFKLGLLSGFDYGKLLNNSGGIAIKISKQL